MIAGFLFTLGTVWAVSLILSLFVVVGLFLNVIFVFGWLIYGGWFFVMMGKRMSVSLRFFLDGLDRGSPLLRVLVRQFEIHGGSGRQFVGRTARHGSGMVDPGGLVGGCPGV